MKKSIYRFISALTFLTKIPIPYNPSIKEENFQKNIIYFPLVGGILGIMLLVATSILENRLSSFMTSFLTIAFYVTLTGGLHLDGVGDSFDGIFSNKEKTQILEVMKDPRMGSNGVLGIILILGAKIFATNDLLIENSYIPIILMPILGRLSLIIACYKGKNARENGMGRTYIGTISKKDFIISIIITTLLIASSTLGLTYLLFPINIKMLMITIALSIAYVLLLRRFVYKKISGITGDILGLICESTEALFLTLCLLLT